MWRTTRRRCNRDVTETLPTAAAAMFSRWPRDDVSVPGGLSGRGGSSTTVGSAVCVDCNVIDIRIAVIVGTLISV